VGGGKAVCSVVLSNFSALLQKYFCSFVLSNFSALLWKENYLRDEHGDPYRVNPFTWQVSLPPVPMSWLFFNYYGLHLIILEATDDAYYNYYSGDPAGQNQYLLPESNIIGGYGLFSSTKYTS